MDPQILLYALAFGLSLLASAFFGGSETALVSLGRIDLQAMREKGDRRGAIIRSLRANTSRLLAVILIAQNLFMSAATASATTLSERLVRAALRDPDRGRLLDAHPLRLRGDDAQVDRRGLARARLAGGRRSRCPG